MVGRVPLSNSIYKLIILTNSYQIFSLNNSYLLFSLFLFIHWFLWYYVSCLFKPKTRCDFYLVTTANFFYLFIIYYFFSDFYCVFFFSLAKWLAKIYNCSLKCNFTFLPISKVLYPTKNWIRYVYSCLLYSYTLLNSLFYVN